MLKVNHNNNQVCLKLKIYYDYLLILLRWLSKTTQSIYLYFAVYAVIHSVVMWIYIYIYIGTILSKLYIRLSRSLSYPDLSSNWTINHWTLALNTDRKTYRNLKWDKTSVWSTVLPHFVRYWALLYTHSKRVYFQTS